MRPLRDKVLIRPLEAVGITPGGIVLPDSAKEKPDRGKVLAVGNGRVLNNGKVVPLEVFVGDEVLYSKYSITEVEYKTATCVVVSESEILAVIG